MNISNETRKPPFKFLVWVSRRKAIKYSFRFSFVVVPTGLHSSILVNLCSLKRQYFAEWYSLALKICYKIVSPSGLTNLLIFSEIR
jgi:hypothetical protein